MVASGGSVTVRAPVDSLTVAGGMVTVDAPVAGDVIAASGTLVVNGDVGGKVLAAGGPDEASPLYRRLRKHGEGIHHIAFSTSHLEDTYQALKRDGVSVSDRLYAEHPDGDESTDVRHCWILPASAHGALIELIDSYGVVDGLLTKAG